MHRRDPTRKGIGGKPDKYSIQRCNRCIQIRMCLLSISFIQEQLTSVVQIWIHHDNMTVFLENRNPKTLITPADSTHPDFGLKAIVQVSRVSYLQSVLISFSSATGSAKILSLILTISTKLPCGNSRRGFFSTSTMWQAGSMISLIRTSISTLAPLALDFEHSDVSQRIVGKLLTR